MIGAVVGFVSLEAVARRSLAPSEQPARDSPPSVLGNAHVLSAGGAIFLVWLLVNAVGGVAGWALVGFAATFVYFLVTALQRIAIARFWPRSRGRASR
jgi:hypothetical protein